mmetsp:Transcript_38641/g.93629  ORF Transcript_38641/g.93629 Transcript_38641/m.93629 type:complete len:290 (+) Transcript_38641:127-996(+)
MKASFWSVRAAGYCCSSMSKNLLLVLLLCVFGTTVRHSNPSYVADAFAAAKKKPNKANKKNNISQASTNRGFGAPPPALLDVLEEMNQKTKSKQLRPNVYDEDGSITSFQDRPCPCGGLSPSPSSKSSSIPYKDCCQQLHDAALGTKYVESPSCLSPLDVLRSRYTAFVMRNAGYIISTTHPECRDYREDKVSWAKSFDKEGLFDSFEFIKLEVLGDDDDEKDDESNSNENEAYISFQVTLQKKDKVDERTIVKERSRFLKDPMKGSWTYAGGDVRSQVEGLQDTQLNQ